MELGGYELIKQLENLKGGERASRKYLECHNKEIQKNGKSQLHRKKAFLEEKPLSTGSTLTLQGILGSPNNRLKVGTTGDISTNKQHRMRSWNSGVTRILCIDLRDFL